MTRLTATNETAAAEPSVVFVTLVDLDFVGGHIRVHDGLGTLSHGGNDYLGVGLYGSVEQVSEDLEISGKGLRLTLSGVPGDLVPDVFTETNYQRRAATLYGGFLNPATHAWVDTPFEIWSGTMDYLEVSGDAREARVTLTVEDELRREALIARYCDEDQQARFPGDTFFRDLPNVANYRSTWGQRTVIMGGGAGGGGAIGGGGPSRANRP